uniref:uncharacterized protein LOC124067952 isoform X2 n=1 Tax=Scatophagus argus TaxID=75038 RepID=UPI001ED7F783|nr:uncharacterized protein LOC124067952 isoform X2 [Scatophagus argus]
MIGRLSALIFLSMLSQTIGIPDQIPLTVAEPGENFTLTCPGPEDRTGMFYWFKLKFGYVVQTVASGSFYKVELQGQFNTSRFTVQKRDGVFVLYIKNVSKEDEATYICQAGATYVMKFTHQMFFAVKDHKNQHKSVYVKQSPTTTSVQPGDSVTLQCSLLFKNKTNGVRCPGEHSVYWFKAGYGKSHPSIIYTHNHSSDEQEKRSCDYSLSETIRDSSDNGTYYCAVVTCGKILFGEGTTVETREELCPFVIVSGTLLICCVIVIVALIICRNQRRCKCFWSC